MSDHDPSCAKCGDAGELYLHSRCHTKSPTWTALAADRGELVVRCSVCHREVGRFKLATPSTTDRHH